MAMVDFVNWKKSESTEGTTSGPVCESVSRGLAEEERPMLNGGRGWFSSHGGWKPGLDKEVRTSLVYHGALCFPTAANRVGCLTLWLPVSLYPSDRELKETTLPFRYLFWLP